MALIYLTSELLFPTSGASVGKNANAKLFFYKNSGSQSVLLEKGHMCICELTDGKFFLYFFSTQNGEEQRFFLTAMEMTKIPCVGPKAIPSKACKNCFAAYHKQ